MYVHIHRLLAHAVVASAHAEAPFTLTRKGKENAYDFIV